MVGIEPRREVQRHPIVGDLWMFLVLHDTQRGPDDRNRWNGNGWSPRWTRRASWTSHRCRSTPNSWTRARTCARFPRCTGSLANTTRSGNGVGWPATRPGSAPNWSPQHRGRCTPAADVHYGLAAAKATDRAATLALARAANPERFTSSTPPKILHLPDSAWINPPLPAQPAE